MNSHHPDLPRLLRDTDALKLEIFPLPSHYARPCVEYVRLCYASVLAATLLSEQHVSEAEGRLFDMLLTSLDLAERSTTVWQMAAALNQDSLREFLQTVQQQQLAASFMLDALVLCRLDGSLSQQQLTLLSELAELLKLPEDALLVLTFWASKVLGLPFDTTLPDSCFDAVLIRQEGPTLTGWMFPNTNFNFKVEKFFAKRGDMLREKQIILISNGQQQDKQLVARTVRNESAGYLHKILLKMDVPMEMDAIGALILPFPPAYAVWRDAVAIPPAQP